MKKKKLIVIIIAFLIIILTALIIILNVFSSKKNSDELVEESLKIREEETKEMIKDYLSDKICPQRMATLYAEYEGKNDLNDLYRGLYNFVGYISEMYPTLKDMDKKELEEYFKENSVKIRKTFGADSVEEFSKFISYLKKIGFSEKYTYKYCKIDPDTYENNIMYMKFNMSFSYEEKEDLINVKAYFANNPDTKIEYKFEPIE